MRRVIGTSHNHNDGCTEILSFACGLHKVHKRYDARDPWYMLYAGEGTVAVTVTVMVIWSRPPSKNDIRQLHQVWYLIL